MRLSGEIETRRQRNADVFRGLGVATTTSGTMLKTIREGNARTVFTIGYERRSLDDLIAALRDVGIDKLIDIRERPISRKPDFRKNVLADACAAANIEYESWVRLGSTGSQREFLKESGDIRAFMQKFRSFARRGRTEEIQALADVTNTHEVALLCYERAHDECHRSVIADLVADVNGASVVAIQ